MKTVISPNIQGIFFLALLIAFLPTSLQAEETAVVSTTPSVVLIGALFDGTQLQVSGTVPAGSDVILRFAGAPNDLHLREKGKVFGLLWMNVGKVTLKNVPMACIIDTSQSFDKLGPAAVPFNLEGLANGLEIEKDAAGEGIDIKKELLLLKKNEGLYNESEGGVVLSPDADNGRNFSGILPIPSALAPGEYTVEAVAIRDGKVIARSSKTITAKMVGFPQWLSKLAFERSLLYGVMATVIALVSGLAIGLVFQRRGAR